jgi:hypothetical protein
MPVKHVWNHRKALGRIKLCHWRTFVPKHEDLSIQSGVAFDCRFRHKLDFWREKMGARTLARLTTIWILLLAIVTLRPHAGLAADLTAFGGIQHAGNLTLQSAQNGTTTLVQNFDPKTFGVFGVRLSHGKVVGGEYTAAYAPNFISSSSHAWIFHSNARVQIPVEFVKPYATAGVGFLNSSGTANALGTEFLFNYGGGANFMVGPLGFNFDVRGYTVPSAHVSGFTIQNRLNFIQTSVGAVLHF